MPHIDASGNLAADPYCTTWRRNRPAACWPRLDEAMIDTGMKEMLTFNVARDTRHQQQWLVVIEELGEGAPSDAQKLGPVERGAEASLRVLRLRGRRPAAHAGRWTEGPSLDGKGKFPVMQNVPIGPKPVLVGPACRDSLAQNEQT